MPLPHPSASHAARRPSTRSPASSARRTAPHISRSASASSSLSSWPAAARSPAPSSSTASGPVPPAPARSTPTSRRCGRSCRAPSRSRRCTAWGMRWRAPPPHHEDAMRNRIVAVLLPLLILLAAAIAIPAGAAMAQRHSSDMLGDRILDASRFASLAQDGMEGPPERIRRELDEYADLYDSAVHVVSRNGDTIHSTSGELAPESIVEAAGPALAGRPPLDAPLITPLGPARVVVATPVGHDSQVVGAVIIDAPTDAVRARILRDWLLVLVAALVPLTVVLLALGPVTDWMLRPLAR